MIECVLRFLHHGKEAIIRPFIEIVYGCDQKHEPLMALYYLGIETIGYEFETLIIITAGRQHWYLLHILPLILFVKFDSFF